ncbi:MAG: anthranilate phosphoribosyltransferase [Enterobacteriaceae bacterium PSmelAO3-2]|nr:anthranilate phosphoribosyltransferase [Enterobacteriaceae bacterium Cmel17]WMC17425.1 MAG: anthranilate phosphoribosyltransferase [Enterobacteriaceae bacterium Cmel21]WMC17631.1 MAG: anthranilate phosphoribosyltransferase [Enterobacteriaceae bacterium PSmelAO3-2]WMC17836.1 MAG: anthranilate phosphoribosyltransferase [Enterobacteriaceae bacterium PSmelAO3-1]WMC18039.1 MAG: anthranilate phosphoribosyltransferase [Enterobacteriaceae bacterium PSmelAO1]
MINKILEKLYNFNFINKFEGLKLINEVYNNKLNNNKIISFVISIKIRGYYLEEILGFVKILLKNTKRVIKPNYLFSDIVGTGGDNINSINISTISAFISSIYGIKILKHGNYGVSSFSGSFDILSKFNINLNVNSSEIINILNKFGIFFITASKYNKIFNKIILIRKKIKSSTIFNIVGPLINPFKPPVVLIGVNDIKLIMIIIKILKILKYKNAAVVHGGGMDEVAIHSNTYISELKKNYIITYQLEPKLIGLKKYPLNKILNSNKKKNYILFKNILKGKGNSIHNKVISANVSLLLKLLGKENLVKNTKVILKIIKSGYSIDKINMFLKKEIFFNENNT